MLGIIFDCDGVLADSERCSCASWLPVLQRRGFEARLEDIEPFIGKSDAALMDAFREKGVPDLNAAALAEREREYFALGRGRIKGFPNELECLQVLKEQSVRTAVASSGRREKIAFTLGEVGLTGFFEVICSSTEVHNGKPAPDVFLLAAQRLSLSPHECWVVEDSLAGIRAARAAGMTAVGFTSTYEAPMLEEAGAHWVFSDYAELRRRVIASTAF